MGSARAAAWCRQARVWAHLCGHDFVGDTVAVGGRAGDVEVDVDGFCSCILAFSYCSTCGEESVSCDEVVSVAACLDCCCYRAERGEA